MSNNKMIANAITAVLAMGLAGSSATVLAESKQEQENKQMMEMMSGHLEGMERCYGIAKAHMNDCGTASHGCSGEAKVDNDKAEWIAVPTGLCSRIAGGSLKGPDKA